MNPDLQKYINDALQQNQTREQIRQSLVSAGWDEAMVDGGLDEALKPRDMHSSVRIISERSATEKSPESKLGIVIAVILYLTVIPLTLYSAFGLIVAFSDSDSHWMAQLMFVLSAWFWFSRSRYEFGLLKGAGGAVVGAALIFLQGIRFVTVGVIAMLIVLVIGRRWNRKATRIVFWAVGIALIVWYIIGYPSGSYDIRKPWI